LDKSGRTTSRGKQTDLSYILEVESTGLENGLNDGCKKYKVLRMTLKFLAW
jgi:hypothetical protein